MPGLLVAALWWGPGVSLAQSGGSSATATIDSRLSFNVNSRLGGRDDPWWTAEVTPGLRLQSRSGRLVGTLDYGLSLATQSRGDKRSAVGNRLSAAFDAALVDQRLFLEGRASVSQQATSSQATQYAPGSSSATFDVTNRTEVASVSLAPSLRGVLGGAVGYEVRLQADASDARRTSNGDQQRTAAVVSLSSAIRGTTLTWGLSALTSETDYRTGRTTKAESAVASMGWLPDPDISFSVRGGTERQDIDSPSARSSNTWGASATWRPSPRTRLQLGYQDRYFGTGWNGVVEYRFPRTAFNLSSSRDSTASLGTAFAPVTQFQALMALYASQIPDVAEREAFVLAQLASLSVDPNQVAIPGFVTGAVSLSERHQAGWSWSGVRLSLSGQAYQAVNRVIDTVVPGLSRAPVRQSGYSGNASYRLTPRSGLTVTGLRQMTRSDALPVGTDLKSLVLSLNHRPGLRTTVSLAARYTVFNSPTEPYREASLLATLGHRF